MAAPRPLGRLLLRGSLLLTAILILWWLALQTPMLAILRVCEDVTLRLVGSEPGDPISVEPSGDWTFRIPVGHPSPTAKIASIEFSMSRSDVVLFTFSLPLYCALALAVPVQKSALRALLYGAAAVLAIEVFSLLGFVEITAQSLLSQMDPSARGLAPWPRDFSSYLLTQVIPFAAPLVIAVASSRELRRQIFGALPHSMPAPE